MKVQKTYFMLMAANVARGAAFYRNAFGLEPRYESPEWTELAQDGATLALHGGGSAAERDRADRGPGSALRGGDGCGPHRR